MKRSYLFGIVIVFVLAFTFGLLYAVDKDPVIGENQCCRYYLPTCNWAYGTYVWENGDLVCRCNPAHNPMNCPLLCADCR